MLYADYSVPELDLDFPGMDVWEQANWALAVLWLFLFIIIFIFAWKQVNFSDLDEIKAIKPQNHQLLVHLWHIFGISDFSIDILPTFETWRWTGVKNTRIGHIK